MKSSPFDRTPVPVIVLVVESVVRVAATPSFETFAKITFPDIVISPVIRHEFDK